MTCIIAEAGVNHNGSVDIAIKLIRKAAEAEVDIIKFQTGKAVRVISQHAPKAEYQYENTGKQESQQEMVKKLELSEADHHTLVNEYRECKVEFLSTPFDMESVTFLTEELKVSRLKMASGKIILAPCS